MTYQNILLVERNTRSDPKRHFKVHVCVGVWVCACGVVKGIGRIPRLELGAHSGARHVRRSKQNEENRKETKKWAQRKKK